MQAPAGAEGGGSDAGPFEARPEETRVEDPTATKEPEQGLRRMRGPCPAAESRPAVPTGTGHETGTGTGEKA